MSLKNNALLITLNISQWVGRKLDRKATATVETQHKTSHRAGSYTKKLLPGAFELELIQARTSSIRKFFYENTLPWAHDGARIISNENYLNFMAEFRTRKAEFSQAVADFVSRYPQLRASAQSQLGDLFNEADYPASDRIASKYSCEILVLPIPDATDFRVDLSDAEKTLFLESMKKVESQALNECYARLHSVVKNAADRLKQPDAIFRDSLISNITELVEILPKLNPIPDSNLDALRSDVQAVISKISAESIRASKTTREDTARELDEITKRMGAFMGGGL